VLHGFVTLHQALRCFLVAKKVRQKKTIRFARECRRFSWGEVLAGRGGTMITTYDATKYTYASKSRLLDATK
jgi:hypothetical protein